MTSVAAPRRSSRSPYVMGGVLLLTLVLVALVAGDTGSSSGGAPLSPNSTGPDGTRGLVLLLQAFGARVQVDQRVPEGDARVALLLNDRLSDADRAELRRWVLAGGTLIVADPTSPFAATTTGGVGGDLPRGTCTLDSLRDVPSIAAPAGSRFEVRGAQSCFGDERSAFVVLVPIGSGAYVSVGSTDVFVNRWLGEGGNSVLAVRLLAPASGESLAILDPNPPGSGRTTLGDLIADRVFQAIVQLGIAFVLYALWRSRRLGRPVTEPQPVAIASSQFVRAVGGLQQRSHGADRAAATLRADTRRVVSERYAIPSTTDADSVAQLVAVRTGLDRDAVAWALGDTPVLDEGTLVELGRQLDIIRQEALDGRRT